VINHRLYTKQQVVAAAREVPANCNAQVGGARRFGSLKLDPSTAVSLAVVLWFYVTCMFPSVRMTLHIGEK